MAKEVAKMSTVEIEAIYDTFLTKGMGELTKLQKTTQMEDEHLANASSQVIVGAMNNALTAFGVLKEGLYVDAKIEISKESRLDNLLIEAMKSQSQHLATVGAGGLVPSTSDFAAANFIRQQVYKKAQGKDITSDDFAFTAGSGYTKP